jgi:hypothetical protein
LKLTRLGADVVIQLSVELVLPLTQNFGQKAPLVLWQQPFALLRNSSLNGLDGFGIFLSHEFKLAHYHFSAGFATGVYDRSSYRSARQRTSSELIDFSRAFQAFQDRLQIRLVVSAGAGQHQRKQGDDAGSFHKPEL